MLSRLSLLTSILLVLSGCATLTPVTPAHEIAAKQAQQYEANGDYQRAADMYWLTAEKVPPKKDAVFRIKAAEMAFVAKNNAQVRAILQRIPERDLSPVELARKRLVEARMAMQARDAQQARDLLQLPRAGLPVRLQEDIAALLGEEFIPVDTTDRKAMLEAMSAHAMTRSQAEGDAIWQQLESMSSQEISQWLGLTKSNLVSGWLELAYIYRTTRDQNSRETSLKAWQEKYQGHPIWPGGAMGVDQAGVAGMIDADVVAVLIPVSGSLEQVSKVVLDGIKAARNSQTDFQPELRIYDTGDGSVNVVDLYQRAVSEGAKLVIGPMQKSNVTLLAREILPVPVLSLNHAEDETAFNPNLYQFALLPEDEARQAAIRLYEDGYPRAIAFAPQGAWGERILNAFGKQFTELGGQVVESALYDAKENDYSPAITQALKVRRGRERHTGSRRQDVDAIFVAAAPRQARIFKPLLKFYFAEDLPVYATSHVYSGLPREDVDRDLNGLYFTDMPWLLKQDPDLSDRIPEPEALSGNDRYYPRLYALGVDGYRLAPQVKNFQAVSGLKVQGYTGAVFMDEGNRLHRELVWSRFTDGLPDQHHVEEEKR